MHWSEECRQAHHCKCRIERAPGIIGLHTCKQQCQRYHKQQRRNSVHHIGMHMQRQCNKPHIDCSKPMHTPLKQVKPVYKQRCHSITCKSKDLPQGFTAPLDTVFRCQQKVTGCPYSNRQQLQYKRRTPPRHKPSLKRTAISQNLYPL